MFDWDDFRYLLAVARFGSLSGAANHLGVNQTTVGRRISAFEQTLETRLFDRLNNRWVLTEAGATAVRRARRIEAEVMGTSAEIAGADDRVAGLVRLTSVGLIANHLLAPRVHELLSSWPDLDLELIDSSANLDLARREADIAIRVARPEIDAAITRRVGRLDFFVYAAEQYAARDDKLQWVVFADSMRDLPESRWLASQVGDQRPQVRVNDIAAMIEVVRTMPARAILPSVSVRPDSGLVPVGRREPVVSRDVWLFFLEGLRGSARVTAVREWAIRVCEEELN